MKILISGEIEVITGLHIGGSSDFSAIGAVSSPVVRDSRTKEPIIPGSSLKGKMRYLLAKELTKGNLEDHNKDPEKVIRLFGNSKGAKDQPIIRARLKYNDCFLSNKKELARHGADPTEIKFENWIRRWDSMAKPRQIERVISGSKFKFDLFYTFDGSEEEINKIKVETNGVKGEIWEDFESIKSAMELLKYDYLGGHGTRGSGRVRFGDDVKVEVVVGELDEGDKSEIEEVLSKILNCNHEANTATE